MVGEDNDGELGDFIEDIHAERPEEAATQSLMEEEVAELLDSLTPRKRMIIRLRFGFEDGRRYTLKKIGQKLGITRERVRQLEEGALKDLRERKGIDILREYLE